MKLSKNYYHMSLEELDQNIVEIREWLFNYEGHPASKKAELALLVALDARELKKKYFDISALDKLC